MMASFPSSAAEKQPRRGFKQILKSYFFWTYPRGCFHYDVMVTLILLFIFATPHLWDFGAKLVPINGFMHPIQVTGYGTHGLLITVPAENVQVPAGASDRAVKEILKHAIQPVAGDAVFVERWQTVIDSQGNLAWKVWAHR
jgi:hypothetical protein